MNPVRAFAVYTAFVLVPWVIVLGLAYGTHLAYVWLTGVLS